MTQSQSPPPNDDPRMTPWVEHWAHMPDGYVRIGWYRWELSDKD